MDSPVISVIIPAYREKEHLAVLLKQIAGDKDTEIIVAVPAGDAVSRASAAEFDVKLVESEKGRGAQLHCGASAAKGRHLMFCHADTILPHGWKETVIKTMEQPGVAGGGFRFSIDSPLFKYRVISAGTNLRVAVSGLVYGDQALFTSREIYERIGGFRPLPVMEDVEFVSRLRKIGKIVIADSRIKTSARRWEKDGAFNRLLLNSVMIFLYLIGVPPERLATLQVEAICWRNRKGGR